MENKLKTLKDILKERPMYAPIFIDLKQEAVKWIKHYGKKREKAKDIVECAGFDGKMYALEIFFNITEEDLMTNEEINNREHGEIGNN